MRGSVVRAGWTLAVVGAAVAVSAGTAEAQGMRLIPQAGLYVPLSDLGRASSGSDAVEIGKRESTLGLGLALEFSSRQPVSFRVNGMYGTESGIPVDDVGCQDCEARGTVAAVTGAVVWRPIPNLIVAQPYLLGGAGLKRYDFDLDDARAEGLDAFLDDRNELTGQLGVGVEVGLLGIRALVELTDFFSGFDFADDESDGGETQHDLFLTLGIALGG